MRSYSSSRTPDRALVDSDVWPISEPNDGLTAEELAMYASAEQESDLDDHDIESWAASLMLGTRR